MYGMNCIIEVVLPYHKIYTETVLNYRDNITKNVHSIIFWPFGLYGRYEGLKTYKQVLNWISVQEITIPNIKMYLGWC